MDIKDEQVLDLSRNGVYKRLAQQQAQKFLNVGYGEGDVIDARFAGSVQNECIVMLAARAAA